MLKLISSLGVAFSANGCEGPMDCNARECFDCACVNSQCECADGWSGPHCETAFCTNRTAGCSGHGDCRQTARNISCSCDAGWEGPHCETSVCQLKCQHGGVPDAKCLTCTGCHGAWTGSNCSTWNTSVPAAQLAARIESLKNQSQAKLLADARYNPICKPAQECVGWGADMSTGKVARYPMLHLDFSDPNGQKWRGLKYPKNVDVTPFDHPGWDEPDVRAFKTYADYKAYVTGLWSSGKGRTGWYSRDLKEVRDGIFNWADHDVSPAITQLAYPTISMTQTASLTVDPYVLEVLQGLGPFDKDGASWRSFFEAWGTSVVTGSRLGGLVESDAYASTALNEDHDVVWLQEQALCAFRRQEGVAGTCAGLDPKYAKYRTGHDFSCLGGNASLCSEPLSSSTWPSQSDWTSMPRLIDYSVKPLSPFIADEALSKALDDAVQAYTASQAAGLPVPMAPKTCNGHGTVPSGGTACTCHACYTGRECSVFDYAPKIEKRSLSATDMVVIGPESFKCSLASYSFDYDSCSFTPFTEKLSVEGSSSEEQAKCQERSCTITAAGKVEACIHVPAASPPDMCATGDEFSATVWNLKCVVQAAA